MNNKTFLETGIAYLELVRKHKPIIHHLTNSVTINDCANCVLALGGSPIMADEEEEIEDIVSIASCLVLNIGTLTKRTLASMVAAGKAAHKRAIPIVLDPVGAGASQFRTEAVQLLLQEVKPSVLRGNLSEIRCIAGLNVQTRGVDASTEDAMGDLEQEKSLARALATRLSCVVAITGAIDIVSDGIITVTISNGRERLASVTGTGCMSTSLVGTFCSVGDDFLVSTVMGIMCMGIAGELGEMVCPHRGLGSFHQSLIDQISLLDAQTLLSRGNINVQ